MSEIRRETVHCVAVCGDKMKNDGAEWSRAMIWHNLYRHIQEICKCEYRTIRPDAISSGVTKTINLELDSQAWWGASARRQREQGRQ